MGVVSAPVAWTRTGPTRPGLRPGSARARASMSLSSSSSSGSPSSKDFTYLYGHGFGSSPASPKGAFLREEFGGRAGVDVGLLDLTGPGAGFSECSVGDMLERIDDARRKSGDPGRPLRLIGQQLGAYAAALYAEKERDRVDALVLLNPAFDLANRLEVMVGGDLAALDRWRETGVHDFSGGRGTPEMMVKFDPLCVDLRQHSANPFVVCPTLLAHGVRDSVTPVEVSRDWCRWASVKLRARWMPQDEAAQRVLLEMDDDNTLDASFGFVVDQALDFFDLVKSETRSEPLVDLEHRVDGMRARDALMDHAEHFQ